MKKLLFILIFISVNVTKSAAQNYANTWCFGDSILMHFDLNDSITFGNCITHNDETSASLSDSSGNLLFYVAFTNPLFNKGGSIYDAQNIVINNGDSINACFTSSKGLIFIPNPGSDSSYYLMQIGYDSLPASPTQYNYLLYSEIIFSSGGIKSVTQKNIRLFPFLNDTLDERMAAVKHANGRDWWIITHSYNNPRFYFYLITPGMVIYHHSQIIGTVYKQSTPWGYWGNQGAMTTSEDGDKLLIVDVSGKIDVFEFDRCNGLLSNLLPLDIGYPNYPEEAYLGCSFSPNGNNVYVSNLFGNLYQYNLNTTMPIVPDTVFLNPNPELLLGHHQLGPDNKIYISNWHNEVMLPVTYYDTTNKYLSVINNPDSIGLSCNFQPHASQLYIGEAHRTYGGLPNMPNYKLGPLTGSICDSILTNNYNIQPDISVTVHPNPTSEFIYITIPEDLKATASISVFNITGQLMFHQPYEEKINLSSLPNGMYLLKVKTKQGVAFRKFVIGD